MQKRFVCCATVLDRYVRTTVRTGNNTRQRVHFLISYSQIMKNINSFIVISLFVALYYLVWVLTLPFFMVQLFLHVAADDDDSNVIERSGQRH